MCYSLRKPLSIYKYYIESEFHLSQSELGWIDVSLLLPYSMVQIFGASLWDSYRFVIDLTSILYSKVDFKTFFSLSAQILS